jgi:hypothetical protein
MTFFRIQAATRNADNLLDPGHQFSRPWNGDTARTRVGVSVCDSIDDLALYLASHLGNGIPVRDGNWVIVELEADLIPGARPLDPEFETLVRPTRIVAVSPVGTDFIAKIEEAERMLASFDEAPLFDEED